MSQFDQRGVEPGDVLWLGFETGKWPVLALTTETGAIGFLSEKKSDGRRRVFRVVIGSAQEVDLVPPTKPALKDKDGHG